MSDLLRWADKLRDHADSPELVYSVAQVMEVRALRAVAQARARALLTQQLDAVASAVASGDMSVDDATEKTVCAVVDSPLMDRIPLQPEERIYLRQNIRRELQHIAALVDSGAP